MSLLEMEDNGSGTPQGVVLVIVGPSPDPHAPTKDTDISKTARLYNLAGLINLARWSISQRVSSTRLRDLPMFIYYSPGRKTT